MDEIIGEFLVESYEGLDQLDQNFIVLEESPDDIATLKEVFRTLHTIKGTCGFLGFGHLERVAHAGENLLSLLRDGELQMTPEITDALLATVDAIREILATIDQTEEEGEPDNEALIAWLGRLAAGETGTGDQAAGAPAAEASATEESPAPAEAEPDGVSSAVDTAVTETPTADAPADDDDGGLVLLEPADADVAPAPAASGPAEEPTPSDGFDDDDGGLVMLQPPEEIAGMSAGEGAETDHGAETASTESTSDIDAAEPSVETPTPETAPAEPVVDTPPAPAEPVADTPPAPAPVEAPPADRIGDRLVDAGAADRTDVEVAAVEQQFGDDRQLGKILVDQGKAKQADVESAAAAPPPRASASESTIRVDISLLDRLMNLVGELVLSRNQIVQLAGEQQDEGLGPPAQRLNLITSELQEGVMKTRMQPINNVWGKLPRVVRDLSNQLGKQVRIEMIGKDTELDRTIIEAIKDPLTHIVRNTVDHGIENPDERQALGKDPEGLLLLRASHEGGQVNIEISDDGKGISADPVRVKAIEKGFLTADQASKMTDNEIVQLIFRPGFSTAGQVSNVSGRGVGMDVVKTNVEKIGGTVDLKTEPGKGTTFKIKIPLTLAIIPALTVTCAGNRYAIPQVSLLELVRLEGEGMDNKIEDLHGAPVYRLRGRLLPIVDLREQLGAEAAQSEITNIVVLKADDHQFGLIVDTIEDTEEIVVKPLGRQVKDVKLFSGATIMGDGRIALILDLLGLAGSASLLQPGTPGNDAIREETVTSTAMTDVLDDRTLLLLGLSENQRVAIPLAAVERLEEFMATAIEQSEGRSVVQYRQKIMPLIDLAPVIGYEGTAFGDERINVVVCSFGGRAVGLAVREVVDIVSHAEVFETVTDESETVVIQDHVTDVIDAAAVVSSILPISYQPPTPEPTFGEPEYLGTGV